MYILILETTLYIFIFRDNVVFILITETTLSLIFMEVVFFLADISKVELMNGWDTYSLPITLVKGSGCYVWDEKGNSYLDCICRLGQLISDIHT